MRTHLPILLLVAIAVAMLFSDAPCAVAAHEARLIAGGWSPIKDVNDPHINELGSWAVGEYNKQVHDTLELIKVVRGEQQVVSGMNYRLVIETREYSNLKNGTYEAVLYEDLADNRQLKSFAPAN